ncbi:unnamed protein product [Symbiodinium sp. CCMP2592]|nr:unnamed protein product [Symbiodinium sp. CCMP2592]
MQPAMDNPMVAEMTDKIFRTTFPVQSGLLQGYFYPRHGGAYHVCDRLEQVLMWHGTRRLWVLSNMATPKLHIATSTDLKTWQIGTTTDVTAPLHEMQTRAYSLENRVRSASGARMFMFSFPQHPGLSGCYEYWNQYKGNPCFKRLPQLCLVKNSHGLWVIRSPSRDLCTSNDLVRFESIDDIVEIVSCTVVEERPPPPEPSEPSSSSRPAPAPAAPAAKKIKLGYDMDNVRAYCRDAEFHGLLTRPNESCDLKVIYEVFARECYRPAKDRAAGALFSPKPADVLLDLGAHIGTASKYYLEQGLSATDSYEPTGTYDLLQQNLGNDPRVRLHRQAVVHETSSLECGGCRFRANSAHSDPHSDAVAVLAGGETYYFTQVGDFQTVVMATSSRHFPLGSKFIGRLQQSTSLDERLEQMRAALASLEFLGLHSDGSFAVGHVREMCERQLWLGRSGVFFGPDLLQNDNTLLTQTSASTWRNPEGRRFKKPADMSFTNWLQELNAQPCLSFADFEGSQVGSWKSSASTCHTLRLKPRSVRLVPAVALSDVLKPEHTIIKMDIEGSELQLLFRPRDWQNTRLLICEFSAGRSRHFGVGPLAFARVLDALRAGGFTHLHVEAESNLLNPRFWSREDNLAANLDFMIWVYRRRPTPGDHLVDLLASEAMERRLRELPSRLRALPGFPQAAKSRKKRGGAN